MAHVLPRELIERILLRLPIKSLFRFKSVSKSWNSMISDSRFIRSHYELSMGSAESDNLFLVHYAYRGPSLVRFESQEFQLDQQFWSSLLSRKGNSTFLCLGDGLILVEISFKTFLLSNPRTRQETILPLPYSCGNSSKMYGVCYDPINEDVKVVVAFKNVCTVYSCKKETWTMREEFPFDNARKINGGGVAIDGAIYWICDKKDSNIEIILCFDLKDDSFRILQKPENLADDEFLELKARKSLLYLYCYGEDWKTVKIWIKEKGGYSWTFLVDVDNLNTERFGLNLVAPFKENEMIISVDLERCYIYNCREKSYREFEGHLIMDPFVDSMFSPIMKRESSRKRKQSLPVQE